MRFSGRSAPWLAVVSVLAVGGCGPAVDDSGEPGARCEGAQCELPLSPQKTPVAFPNVSFPATSCTSRETVLNSPVIRGFSVERVVQTEELLEGFALAPDGDLLLLTGTFDGAHTAHRHAGPVQRWSVPLSLPSDDAYLTGPFVGAGGEAVFEAHRHAQYLEAPPTLTIDASGVLTTGAGRRSPVALAADGRTLWLDEGVVSLRSASGAVEWERTDATYLGAGFRPDGGISLVSRESVKYLDALGAENVVSLPQFENAVFSPVFGSDGSLVLIGHYWGVIEWGADRLENRDRAPSTEVYPRLHGFGLGISATGCPRWLRELPGSFGFAGPDGSLVMTTSDESGKGLAVFDRAGALTHFAPIFRGTEAQVGMTEIWRASLSPDGTLLVGARTPPGVTYAGYVADGGGAVLRLGLEGR